MARSFHANMYDGAQWVFWLRQGGRSKSISFNNHFPPPIRKFAAVLDEELIRCGAGSAKWSNVPRSAYRNHEKALRESIRR